MTDKEQAIKALAELTAAIPACRFRGVPLNEFDKAQLVLITTLAMEERDKAQRRSLQLSITMGRAYDLLLPWQNEP